MGIEFRRAKDYRAEDKLPVVLLESKVEGALPKGTRIVKLAHKEGDAHETGSGGVVLSSYGVPEMFGYFVEWDDMPGVPVFVASVRVRKEV